MHDNLSIVVLGVSIIAILTVAIRQNLFQDILDMITSTKIGKHNVEYRLSPDRRKPIITVDKEFGLKQLNPTFFNNFDDKDWQEFWDIIYGMHPLINFQDEKLPAAERNYSILEIQDVLIKRYPEGFSGFAEEHWKMFWKEIFGIIDYKLEIPGGDEWAQKQRDRADRKLYKKLQKDEAEISATIDQVRREIGK